MVKHLIRTMESISSEAARARAAQKHSWASDAVEEIDPTDGSEKDPVGSRVEAAAAAREELEQLEGLFENDQEALEVLRCRAMEFSPSEACSRLGIERKRYDTVNKRIWRTLLKYSKKNEIKEGR